MARTPTKQLQEDLETLQSQMRQVLGVVDTLKSEVAMKDAVIVKQQEEIERSYQAKNNPAIVRDRFDTREEEVVEERERVMRSTGEARDALDLRELEVIDKPVTKDKLASLAFMEEMVTIKVHDTTDENQVPMPPVWNDGKVVYFRRGEEQTVPRKFVERLARAKITTYTQRKEFDAAGNEVYVQVPHTAPIFPFEVIHDPNPKGREWLRSVVRDPH